MEFQKSPAMATDYSFLYGLLKKEEQKQPDIDPSVEWRRKVTDRVNEDKKKIEELTGRVFYLEQTVQTLQKQVQWLMSKNL